MRMRTLLVLGLLALPVLAAEERPLPRELPPYGADRPIPLPRITRETLPNGLTVWLVQRDGSPRLSLTLATRGGMASDPADAEGISGLLARVLTEGTRTRSARRIAEDLQQVGGSISAASSPDALYTSVSGLAGGLPTLVEVLADVAQHASFPAQEVELAKGNALQELKASSANSGFQANRAFLAEVFGSHPYHRAMALDGVLKAATPASLQALHARRFRPDRALLVVAGNLEGAHAMKLVTQAFGAWKGTGDPLPDTAPAPREGHREIVLVERPGSIQASLRVGRPLLAASHPDLVPLDLANVVLGGSFDSRITKNLREDKGYTYSPGSMTLGRQAGGSFQVRAEVRSEVTGASLNEIFYEMDRMGTTTVPDEELARAKRYMAGIYLFRNQLQDAVASTLATLWVNGLPPEHLGAYVTQVNAVTAARVREVAARYFATKDQTVVAVGDPTRIRADLEHFGTVRTVAPYTAP